MLNRAVFAFALACATFSADAQTPETASNPPPAGTMALQQVQRNAAGVFYLEEGSIRREAQRMVRVWTLSVVPQDRVIGETPISGIWAQTLYDCDARTGDDLHVAMLGTDLNVQDVGPVDRPARPINVGLSDMLDFLCGTRPDLPGPRAASAADAVRLARGLEAPAEIAPTPNQGPPR